MAEKFEKANVSFSYRINKDGTYALRLNHIGMPHKDEVETGKCDICRFLTRRLEKLHSEIFHLTLNRGLFEPPMPKVVQPPTPNRNQGGSGTTLTPTTEQIYE